MFTCITCAKQKDGRGEKGGGAARGVPSTKESVHSLTDQIKDMALRFSGNYKQYKPCTSPSAFRKEYRPYPDFGAASEGIPYPYMQPGSSNSTPAWYFTSTSHNRGGRLLSRFGAGDSTPGGQESTCTQSDVVLEDEDEPKEWMAEVEPGVHITFLPLPNGGNDLQRIRFSREIFNKWQAQRWWGENYDRIMELYNVQKFNRQASNTPISEDDRDSSYTRIGSSRESPMMTPSLNKDWTPRHHYKPSVDASRTTTSSKDEEVSLSNSNASDLEAEWVEQDEPGVFITIRQLTDGTRELRRVRFSRERFREVHAKLWWEHNRERIQAQYL